MQSSTNSSNSSATPERKAINMDTLIEIVFRWIAHSNCTVVLLDAALKSVVVLALAGGCCLCWRRASAATRHWLWFLAIGALFCLPFLSFTQPPWQKPI